VLIIVYLIRILRFKEELEAVLSVLPESVSGTPDDIYLRYEKFGTVPSEQAPGDRFWIWEKFEKVKYDAEHPSDDPSEFIMPEELMEGFTDRQRNHWLKLQHYILYTQILLLPREEKIARE
jgi:hypothetical protein